MHRLLLVLTTFSLLVIVSCQTTSPLSQPLEPPLVQSSIDKNSCGPCALVHSFAYASPHWRQSDFFKQSLAQQARNLIERAKAQPSKLNPKQTRWQSRLGMRTPDLLQVANELSPHTLSKINLATPKSLKKKNGSQLAYNLLNHSLKKGFPPILSIKRQVHQKFHTRSGYYWIKTFGHFVSVIQVSPPADTSSTYFQITYVDSLDGKLYDGKISMKHPALMTTSPISPSQRPFSSPFLNAQFPHLGITRGEVPKNGIITTEIDSAIGSF